MIIDSNPTLIVIVGPTAVGKTSAGIHLAKQLQTEIISSDSRQFYKEMSIGTARPTPEELATVPHHFIGHLSIHDTYNVSQFEHDALMKLDELFQKHATVVMVGGSGLYINAVCEGIDELPDPDESLRMELKELLKNEGVETLAAKLKELDSDYYNQVDRANPNRLLRALEVCITTGIPYSKLRKMQPKQRPFQIQKIGLTLPREELNKRIETRVDQMMKDGLLAEVESLLPYRNLNALNTVGYKELFEYLDGNWTLDQAIEKIKTNTRRYAKRQMTWFRRDAGIKWKGADELMS